MRILLHVEKKGALFKKLVQTNYCDNPEVQKSSKQFFLRIKNKQTHISVSFLLLFLVN